MTFRPTTLERAFELARSGKFASTTDVRNRLKDEGFDLRQLEGRSLINQLRTICAESGKPDGAGPAE